MLSPESITRRVKREIDAKDGDPNRNPAARGQRKSPYGQRIVERSWTTRRRNDRNDGKASGRNETQKSQPQTNGYRKRKKRKESEPCIDVGSLGDENAETNPDEEPTDTTKWMDDVSKLERSMSGMQWNMTEVERKLDRGS